MELEKRESDRNDLIKEGGQHERYQNRVRFSGMKRMKFYILWLIFPPKSYDYQTYTIVKPGILKVMTIARTRRLISGRFYCTILIWYS